MKPVLISVLFAISFSQLFGQADSTFTITDSSHSYLTPLEYAFMTNEETRFMLRMPAVGVGIEAEILPYFTLMTQARLDNQDNFARGLKMESELRYYYSSKKKGVRNMSGNYIAGGASYFDGINYFGPTEFQTHGSNMYTYIRWGMQRRMLGNGLIDLGVLAGFQSFSAHKNKEGYGSVRIATSTSVGLGLVFGERDHLDWEKLCPATKCHEVERFMLKFSVNNILNYWHYTTLNSSTLWVNPKIALEQKILQSPFSVNANFNYNFGLSRAMANGTPGDNAWHNLNIRMEGRWYYNLKRRMLQGKSGNGLSANYFAIGVMKEHQGFISSSRWNLAAPYVITGIQRTIGKHFFIDLNIGVAGQNPGNTGRMTLMPIGDLQVGFRF